MGDPASKILNDPHCEIKRQILESTSGGMSGGYENTIHGAAHTYIGTGYLDGKRFKYSKVFSTGNKGDRDVRKYVGDTEPICEVEKDSKIVRCGDRVNWRKWMTGNPWRAVPVKTNYKIKGNDWRLLPGPDNINRMLDQRSFLKY